MDEPNNVVEMKPHQKRSFIGEMFEEFREKVQGSTWIAMLTITAAFGSAAYNLEQIDEIARAEQKISKLEEGTNKLQDKFDNALARVRDLERNEKLIVDGYKLLQNLQDCDFNHVELWFAEAFHVKFVRTKDVPEYKDPEQFQKLLKGMTNRQRQALLKRQLDLTINDLCKKCPDTRSSAPEYEAQEEEPATTPEKLEHRI